MEVYHRIWQLLKQRNWSLYRLSKEAGLSQSTITHALKRGNSPSIPTLEAICRALGMTLAQFFSNGEAKMELTQEQAMLISKWNTLSREQKDALLQVLMVMQ